MPFPRYPSGSCPCQVSLPFELRHFPAGSLFPLSRIEFVSYRLVVLLRLLPTPPHDDAVAVEYGPENVCPVGTFTLLFKCAYERTRRTPGGPIRSPHGSHSALAGTSDSESCSGQGLTAPGLEDPDLQTGDLEAVESSQRRDRDGLRGRSRHTGGTIQKRGKDCRSCEVTTVGSHHTPAGHKAGLIRGQLASAAISMDDVIANCLAACHQVLS